MSILSVIAENTGQQELPGAIAKLGDSENLSESDLLTLLKTAETWLDRFTTATTIEHRNELITWYRYESLTWALGEAFRQIMQRHRQFRRNETVFEAIRTVCLDRRFGKGRESFTMLLGRYGGRAQVPTLINLLEDPQVAGHAVYGLRLLAAPEAAERVRPFLDSQKTWIRQEARRYFEKVRNGDD